MFWRFLMVIRTWALSSVATIAMSESVRRRILLRVRSGQVSYITRPVVSCSLATIAVEPWVLSHACSAI